MRKILSIYKRFNGKEEQWNLADEPQGQISAEIERSWRCDEAARLREKWRLDAIMLRIRQQREINEFNKLKNLH